MKKNLLYTALGLMGIMGTLTIGVVSAETTISEPYGHIDYKLNGNEDFEAQVITITSGTDTITILDRNLGAKKAGTGCDKNTNGGYCPYDEVYGYHFQWGNNHGFKPGCDLSGSTDNCSDTITSSAVNGQVDVTTISYDPNNQEYYESGVFYKVNKNNWLNDNSKVDLWGGSTGGTDTITSTSSLNGDNWKVDESTVTNRQGPCPRGWHVPSIGELNKLVSMMTGSNNKEKAKQLHSDLYIPFAGYRYATTASVFNMGTYAYLWSSSPYSAESRHSRYRVLNVYGDVFLSYDFRANALSVRCFYDSYQPFTQSFTLSFTGSEGGSVSTGSIEAEEGSSISRDDIEGTVSISGTVVATGIADEGYVFSGWTTDCGETLTANCTFTGEFKEILYEIEFTGNNVSTGKVEVTSGSVVNLTGNEIASSDTKDGYLFVGWNTDSGANEGLSNITVTGNITLFSIFQPITYKVSYDAKGGDGTITDQVFTYDLSGNLAENTFTKTGYVFSGWKYNDEIYTGNQEIKNLTGINGAIITMVTQWTPITYTISFSGNAADATGTAPDTINAEYDSGDIAPDNTFTLTGYTFTGWNTQSDGSGTGYTAGAELKNLTTTSGEDVKLYAQWEVNIYKLSFVVDGNSIQSRDIAYGITISAPANPTKDSCNSFAGWTSSVEGVTTTGTMPDSDVIFTANWNYTCSRSSGGGGDSSRSNKTSDTQDSSTSSQNDSSVSSGANAKDPVSDTPMDSSDKSSEGQEILSPSDNSFTKEQKDAYTFAHEKGITTMPTINDANMDGKLTRIAMAKMLSYYAINVLGQKPDETRINKFNDITEKLDSQYDSGVTLAYQLGIMGINMPNNNFRPNDEVTRAEFATALSRMLYSTPDGKPYYVTHLEKLKAEGILKNDDYKMKELRGYVMIMLMRSAK